MSRVQVQALLGPKAVLVGHAPLPLTVSPEVHSRVKSKPSTPAPILVRRSACASRPIVASGCIAELAFKVGSDDRMPVSFNSVRWHSTATSRWAAVSTPEALRTMRHNWPCGWRTIDTVYGVAAAKVLPMENATGDEPYAPVCRGVETVPSCSRSSRGDPGARP